MRRWIVPLVAASFAGTMIVGNLTHPTDTLTRSLLEGAAMSLPGAQDQVQQIASSSLSSSLSTSVSTPTCASHFKGSPAQAIVVRASGTKATVIGCTRKNGVYHRTLGPFSARVGNNGLARPGAKREGDGRTPSGTFRMSSGFGTAASPGLEQGWLRVDSRDVWVDDPASALYNTHQRLPAKSRWKSAERLKIPAYTYAQVIAYNTGRLPGRGSAIFMHVGTTPTAGCVALKTSNLLKVMRWQHVGAVMVIS